MRKSILYMSVAVWLTPGSAYGQLPDLPSPEEHVAAWNEDSLRHIMYEYNILDNAFYTIQAGVNHTWKSNEGSGLALRPSVAFSLGKWFSPTVGLRALASLNNSRGFIKKAAHGYSWQSFDFDMDGLISLSNFLKRYREPRRLNVVATLGIGAVRTFGFSHPEWNDKDLYFRSKGRSMLVYRFGVIGLWRLNDKWDFSLEASHNLLHDSFDGHVTNHHWDRRTNFYAGVSRRIRNSDETYEFRYVRYDFSKFDETNREINRLRQQEAAAKALPAPVKEVGSRQVIVLVSFPEKSTVINRMQEVNIYTIVQSWQRFGKPVKIYMTPLGASASRELFHQRVAVISQTLSERYQIPSEYVIIEEDGEKITQLDKTEDQMIVYISESKKTQ